MRMMRIGFKLHQAWQKVGLKIGLLERNIHSLDDLYICDPKDIRTDNPAMCSSDPARLAALVGLDNALATARENVTIYFPEMDAKLPNGCNALRLEMYIAQNRAFSMGLVGSLASVILYVKHNPKTNMFQIDRGVITQDHVLTELDCRESEHAAEVLIASAELIYQMANHIGQNPSNPDNEVLMNKALRPIFREIQHHQVHNSLG